MTESRDILAQTRKKTSLLTRFTELSYHLLESLKSNEDSKTVRLLHERESILGEMENQDRNLMALCKNIQGISEFQREIQKSLNEFNSLLDITMALNKRIELILTQQREQIARELVQTQQCRTQMQKFKSYWNSEAGQRIDGRI